MPDPVVLCEVCGVLENVQKRKGSRERKGRGGGKDQKWVKRVCGNFLGLFSCFHYKLRARRLE